MPENNKAICFDHNKGMITTNEDKVVNINGCMLIGDGKNLPENEENPLEEGLLKVIYNNENGKYQLCQTDRNGHWQIIGEPYDETIDMIFALIMCS